MTTHEREQLEGLIQRFDEAEKLSPACSVHYLQGLRDFRKALESLLSEMGDGWISVEDRLPTTEDYPYPRQVVCVVEKGCLTPTAATVMEVRSFPERWTHWQPLPGGPKK